MADRAVPHDRISGGGISYRGSCGCGWRGSWRTNDDDAKADASEHCRETGCVLGKPVGSDDLMPHERGR